MCVSLTCTGWPRQLNASTASLTTVALPTLCTSVRHGAGVLERDVERGEVSEIARTAVNPLKAGLLVMGREVAEHNFGILGLLRPDHVISSLEERAEQRKKGLTFLRTHLSDSVDPEVSARRRRQRRTSASAPTAIKRTQLESGQTLIGSLFSFVVAADLTAGATAPSASKVQLGHRQLAAVRQEALVSLPGCRRRWSKQ